MQHRLLRDVAALTPEQTAQPQGIAEQSDLLQHEFVIAVASTL